MNGNIDRDYRTMLQALADSRTVVLSLLSQLGLTDFRESHLQELVRNGARAETQLAQLPLEALSLGEAGDVFTPPGFHSGGRCLVHIGGNLGRHLAFSSGGHALRDLQEAGVGGGLAWGLSHLSMQERRCGHPGRA